MHYAISLNRSKPSLGLIIHNVLFTTIFSVLFKFIFKFTVVIISKFLNVVLIFCSGSWIRTNGLWVMSPTRYQTSPSHDMSYILKKIPLFCVFLCFIVQIYKKVLNLPNFMSICAKILLANVCFLNL